MTLVPNTYHITYLTYHNIPTYIPTHTIKQRILPTYFIIPRYYMKFLCAWLVYSASLIAPSRESHRYIHASEQNKITKQGHYF